MENFWSASQYTEIMIFQQHGQFNNLVLGKNTLQFLAWGYGINTCHLIFK